MDRRELLCLTAVLGAAVTAPPIICFASEPRKSNVDASAPGKPAVSGAPVRVNRVLRISSDVTAIAWSEPLQRLAVACDFGRSIQVFDRDGERTAFTRGAYVNLSPSLFFIPNTRLIAGPAIDEGSDQTDAMLCLWDADNGTFARHIAGPFPDGDWTKNRAGVFAVSKDCRRIVAVPGGRQGSPLVIINTDARSAVGQEVPTHILRQAFPERDILTAIDISSDARFIVAGSAGSRLAVLDTQTDEFRPMPEPFPSPVSPNITAVRLHPSATFVAVGSDQPSTPGPAAHARHVPPLDYFVAVWTVPTGALYCKIPGNVPPIRYLAWSPNGFRLAVAGGDEAVRVWRIQTGTAQLDCVVNLPDTATTVEWLGSDQALLVAAGDTLSFVSV